MLSGRRKLLLADDSPTVQKVISLFLEEEGIEVVAVGDGREALRLLEEERPPDILIADVWMPGPDGYELCERVKSDERLRHIPVILLVSKFEPFNEAEARRVGADTVLTKPFQSIRDLVSRVGSLLGGGPKREETAPERTPREESAAEASHARAESQATDADARAPHAAAQADERAVAFDSELAQPFGDPGADDELIEAKPAESFFEPARAEAAERAAAPEEIEVSEQAEEFETIAHAPDVLAARHDAAHEPFGTNGQAAISHEAQHAGESLMPARSSFAARAAGAAAADDALLDLGQFEPPTSGHAAEADDFILDLEEDLPAPHAAQNLFAQPDEPSAFAEASHGTPASSFDEPASSFDERASSFGEPASSFDPSARPHDAARGHDAAAWEVVMQEPEVVAQDEPQFSAAASVEHEAGPAPRGFVEPSVVPAEEPVPAPSESEYADGSVEGDVPKPPAVAHAAPSEPSPAGYAVGEARAGVEESERAGQLSREDVDAIARRVVELMSERVIREIAWEVVPELAELLVKRKLEEEG
ncbi:MAG: response regulator [Acidobacteriota bacterium]|nr:response regulator [Acidobacteriota bacterium]